MVCHDSPSDLTLACVAGGSRYPRKLRPPTRVQKAVQVMRRMGRFARGFAVHSGISGFAAQSFAHALPVIQANLTPTCLPLDGCCGWVSLNVVLSSNLHYACHHDDVGSMQVPGALSFVNVYKWCSE